MIRTIHEGDAWRLQTALLHLRHSGGRRVRLMSMIHIAEPAFYDGVNALIAEHEASGGLIFFEGLGQLSESEVAELTPAERAVYEGLAPLTEAYRTLAAALDLAAQPDALTKPKPDWVRADLPMRRLLATWATRQLPLLPALDAAGKALDSAFFKGTARFMLLQEPLILGAFQFARGVSPVLGRMGALLLDERNAAAIAAFDAAPAEQDALIIYGAGHVAGLVAALQERGYRRAGRDWHTAMSERIDPLDWLRAAFGAGQGARFSAWADTMRGRRAAEGRP